MDAAEIDDLRPGGLKRSSTAPRQMALDSRHEDKSSPRGHFPSPSPRYDSPRPVNFRRARSNTVEYLPQRDLITGEVVSPLLGAQSHSPSSGSGIAVSPPAMKEGKKKISPRGEKTSPPPRPPRSKFSSKSEQRNTCMVVIGMHTLQGQGQESVDAGDVVKLVGWSPDKQSCLVLTESGKLGWALSSLLKELPTGDDSEHPLDKKKKKKTGRILHYPKVPQYQKKESVELKKEDEKMERKEKMTRRRRSVDVGAGVWAYKKGKKPWQSDELQLPNKPENEISLLESFGNDITAQKNENALLRKWISELESRLEEARGCHPKKEGSRVSDLELQLKYQQEFSKKLLLSIGTLRNHSVHATEEISSLKARLMLLENGELSPDLSALKAQLDVQYQGTIEKLKQENQNCSAEYFSLLTEYNRLTERKNLAKP